MPHGSEHPPVPLREPVRNPLVAEAIGPFYVYLLIDPATDEIFYVGKGQENALLLTSR